MRKKLQMWKRIRRIRINRQYKDRLFRLVFQNKKDLLDLYNAVHGTDYKNPDDMEITTLNDVVYLGMKNDISFLIGCRLNLYEHQSTWNPNMPLRGFLYFGDMIRAYIEQMDLDIYGTKRVMLPMPRYIIFYNGTKEQPDRSEMFLSEAFLGKDGEQADLECRALMLNINKGHNQDIMDKCKQLADYAYFVQAVRDYLDRGYPLKDAADLAVAECIEKDILGDILKKNRAEVMDVLLTTYNKKQHKRTIEREAREEGLAQGRAEGIEQGRVEGEAHGIERGVDRTNELNRFLLRDGREADMLRSITDPDFQKKLFEEYNL